MKGAVKIMKLCLTLLFLITVIEASMYGSCCSSYASCCTACGHQPSCCSNCCQKSGCCNSDKSADCCRDQCTSLPCTSSPTTPCPPPVIVTVPAVSPTPPRPAPPGSSGSSSSTSDSANSISTNLKLDNTISNTNKIYVPVTISNTNTNNLQSNDTSVQSGSKAPDTETLPPYVAGTTSKPIGYPIFIPIPQPYHVPIPYLVPQRQHCCTVIQPCVQMYCKQYSTHCSDQCTHPVMYRPHNPCEEYGCSKRSYWSRKSCHTTAQYPFVNCRYVNQDCSHCTHDFYQNYHSYQQCHGCFY